MAPGRRADAVLRRRRGRGAGGRAGRRAGAAADRRPTARCASPAAGGRGPRHPGAPRRPAAFAAVLARRGRWRRRCSTCCGRATAATRRRRAPALRARLDAAAARIRDKAPGQRVPLARCATASSPRRPATRRTGRAAALGGRSPHRAPPVPATAEAERHRCLLAILLRHPDLLRDVEEALSGLPLPPTLTGCATRSCTGMDRRDALDSDDLMNHLHASGLRRGAQVLSARSMPLPACAAPVRCRRRRRRDGGISSACCNASAWRRKSLPAEPLSTAADAVGAGPPDRACASARELSATTHAECRPMPGLPARD